MMMKKLTVKKPALKKFAAGGTVAKKPMKKYADGGMLPVGSIAGPSTPQPDPAMQAMQQQMASDKAIASGKKAPPSPAPAPAPAPRSRIPSRKMNTQAMMAKGGAVKGKKK